jgi:hypothetical protein
MGLPRDTVGRFLQAEAFPEQAPRHRPNQITAFEPYLRERWNAGEQNAAALWRELRVQGYPGAVSSLRGYVRRWRIGPLKTGRRPDTAPQAKAPLTVHLDTPRKTRWLLLQSAEERDAAEQHYVRELLTLCPQIAQAQALAMRFLALLTSA